MTDIPPWPGMAQCKQAPLEQGGLQQSRSVFQAGHPSSFRKHLLCKVCVSAVGPRSAQRQAVLLCTTGKFLGPGARADRESAACLQTLSQCHQFANHVTLARFSTPNHAFQKEFIPEGIPDFAPVLFRFCAGRSGSVSTREETSVASCTNFYPV